MSADRVAKLNAGHSPSKHSNTALIPSLDKPLIRALVLPNHLNNLRLLASERHDIGSPSILNMRDKTYLGTGFA